MSMRPPIRAWVICSVLAIGLSSGGLAMAQPTTEPSQRATELYKKGNELYDKGKFADAEHAWLPKLLGAQKLETLPPEDALFKKTVEMTARRVAVSSRLPMCTSHTLRQPGPVTASIAGSPSPR